MDSKLNVNNIKEIATTINFADIITDMIKDNKKIKSDVDRLSDRKKDRYYRDYKISPGERIIAYYKISPLGMIFAGCIFTNKAFYCNYAEKVYINYKSADQSISASEKEHELIRIEYSDLCNYIVCRKSGNANSSTGLCNKDIFIDITGISIFKNPLAEEVYDLFIKLSEIYMDTDKTAEKKMDELEKHHYSLAVDEVKSGIFPCGREMVFKSFVRLVRYRNKALILLAEHNYRMCNPSKYEKFLKEFEDYISDDFKTELEEMTNIFANRLINALSDLKNKFPEEYLEDVYNNLKRIDTTKEMTVVLIYVCIRLNMHDFARERISVYEQMYGKDDRAKKWKYAFVLTVIKK